MGGCKERKNGLVTSIERFFYLSPRGGQCWWLIITVFLSRTGLRLSERVIRTLLTYYHEAAAYDTDGRGNVFIRVCLFVS